MRFAMEVMLCVSVCLMGVATWLYLMRRALPQAKVVKVGIVCSSVGIVAAIVMALIHWSISAPIQGVPATKVGYYLVLSAMTFTFTFIITGIIYIRFLDR